MTQLGLPGEPNRCVAASFVEFAEHPGATRYVAHVLNSFYADPQDQEFPGPPFQDDWTWGPDVHFTVTGDKRHWLFVSSSSKGNDPNCTAEDDQRAHITLLSLQAEVGPEFTAQTARGTPLEALTVSEKLLYEGNGWDPGGGPIEVLWNGTVVATHAAATSFSGELATPDFPDLALIDFVAGFSRCEAQLSARQGATEVALDATGTLGEVVYWAAGGVRYGDGRVVQHQSVICRGTLLYAPGGTPFVGNDVCSLGEPLLLVTAGPFRPAATGDDRPIGTYEGLWIQYLSDTGYCVDLVNLYTNVLGIEGLSIPLPGLAPTDSKRSLIVKEAKVILRPPTGIDYNRVLICQTEAGARGCPGGGGRPATSPGTSGR